MDFRKGNTFLKKFCLCTLVTFLFLGLFAPFLANEKPILVIDGNNEFHFFPVQNIVSIKHQFNAPIPYSPHNIDIRSMGSVGPFDEQEQHSLHNRHWLGTDLIGRDILSALIHGSQTSLSIGFAATLIAGLLGILIGGLAGYFGDSSIKASGIRTAVTFLLSIFFLFYFIQIQQFNHLTSDSLLQFLFYFFSFLLLLVLILFVLNYFLKQAEINFKWKKKYLGIDSFLSRLMEIVSTLPTLFIIITLSAIIRPSVWNVVLIIGFTGWTSIARYTRAEFLSLKSEEFVLSARSLGLPNHKIFFNHILPNAYTTIFTALAFTFAGVILTETTLSFLGVGLPPEEVSWGSVLSMARQRPDAWWLVFFPSLCIFLVIFSLHYLASYYTKTAEDR